MNLEFSIRDLLASSTGVDVPHLRGDDQALEKHQTMLSPLLGAKDVHRHDSPVKGTLNLWEQCDKCDKCDQ